MTPRCLWTGQSSDRAIEITVEGVDRSGRPTDAQTLWVLPEHADDLRAYVALARRVGRRFLGAVAVYTVAVLLAVALGAAGVLSNAIVAVFTGVTTALLGLAIVVFPLATPETVGIFGVRRSKRLARVAGAITAAVGVWIALAG